RRAVGDAPRHEQRAADQRDQTEPGDREEGRAPAEVLAEEGAQRDAGDEGDGHAAEHRGDRAGGFFLRHQAGGDDRADREEHAVGQAGEHARDDQGGIARRQPGDHVAGGEQGHQADQQRLARHPPGQRGQQRRADGDGQRVQADQQAGRGQVDAEVGGEGGDQADDDELGGADGEGA
ncbi:hypothetical protein CATMIT_01683, partial [Catenibacterium mitsuokai DSM 15897]